MSKIGKRPITLPAGTTVALEHTFAVVTGPKGELRTDVPHGIKVTVEEGMVHVSRPESRNDLSAKHGLIRSLINNMVLGVSQGFVRKLQLVGTGYRVAKKGAGLNIAVGYSHPVTVEPTPGITLDVDGNTNIIVSGIDKHAVGQMAANIRKIRPPEPYKGKGIRYEDEVVRRKQGKAVAK